MALTYSWRARIEAWLKALDQLTYHPLGKIPLSAHFTYDQLTPEQARKQPFEPIDAGEPWGAKWQYAWFSGNFGIEADHPERLVLQAGQPTPQFGADPYGEWRIFVNGQEMGSRDWAHPHLPLAECTRRGDTFAILAEAFGGPSRAGGGGGPALHGVPTLPEPPAKQRILPELTYGLWREEAFQLWIDVRTLYELRDLLPADSLRVAGIDAGLRDFTLIADPELPQWEQILPTLVSARERLRPLLECVNGSTAPTLFCIGHSHLDIVYQWPLKESERKVARTFYNQLGLMDAYPEYRYLQSMPVLYEIAKRLYPELYTKIKSAIDRGQWIPEGAMWTEPDCNLPSGESLIRQILYGKRFFQEEFGVDSTLLWLPDTFGFSGAMPQILLGCGIRHFASSKIFCVFARDSDPFPHSSFWWEGIDGSRIFTHFFADYGIRTHPKEIARQWDDRPQKDGIRARMAVYGHSDGGGGCEREHLEFLRRQKDLEGLPRCKPATPAEFFAYQQAQPEALPVYNGEIYLPAHRGTYTTHAAIKKGNRYGETLLREAELWAAAATRLTAAPYPRQSLELAWKNILFNQFHDILPGSCIQRAAEEARQLYAETFALLDTLIAEATTTLANSIGATEPLLFNSLPWPRQAVFCVEDFPQLENFLPKENAATADAPQHCDGKRDSKGSSDKPASYTQHCDSKRYLSVCLPASGWATLEHSLHTPAHPVRCDARTDSALTLENEHLAICVNNRGEITSWLDKATGRELAAAPLNVFHMYRDQPYLCDAWEIEAHYKEQALKLDFGQTRIECVCKGPLLASIRIRHLLNNSSVEQEIRLAAGAQRIEFHTRVNWQETHKLLKVDFPLAVHATEALHETQFGYVARPTHRSTKVEQDRFEVPQQRWSALAENTRGVALLNDCKYGISTEGSTLSLTLLRAPQAPDMTADIGHHTFTYALYAWEGSLAHSALTAQAMELNTPLQAARACINDAALDRDETNACNSGKAPTHKSDATLARRSDTAPASGSNIRDTRAPQTLFSCDAPNIVIDSVKLAEDGSGDMILRLYESSRTATRCTFLSAIPFAAAQETDMLEGNGKDCSHSAEGIVLDFRPFEIKTLRLARSELP